MREIKFRAYFLSEARMGKKATRENVYSSHEGQSLDDFIKETQEVGIILMQYTGLKDKNGKEIYEGDVLNFQNQNMKNPELLGYIKYHAMRACYTVGIHFNAYGLPLFEECDDSICDAKNFEIIGNVYENPNLLEEG